MPRYQFRMAALRRLREIRRDELRGRLAEAYSAIRIVDDRIGHLEQELLHLTETRRSALLAGRPDVNHLLAAQRYEVNLTAELQTLAGQRKQLAAEAEARRLAVVEADRDVRMLDKLDEKQRQAFDKVREAAAIKVMDEIAQRTYREE